MLAVGHTTWKLTSARTFVSSSSAHCVSYSQELPRRFRQDIVKAARTGKFSSPRLDSAVSAEGVAHVLDNIGMGDRMSRSEIEGIFAEVGARPAGGEEGECVLSEHQMMDLISRS